MPDVTTSLTNPQVIEIWVTGPEGANRLFICSGQLPFQWANWQGSGQVREIYTFHVGPQLGRRELIRATCAAGIMGFGAVGSIAPNNSAFVRNADADWDDEDGRVQVSLELEANGPVGLYGFHYHVTILAQQAE